MRVALLTIFLSLSYFLSFSQVSVNDITMPQGEYAVGFKHFTLTDSSRTYHRYQEWTKTSIPRPIPVSIWYPAKASTEASTPLLLADYMLLVKEEEEWENLPDDMILNWFEFPNTPANQVRLKQSTRAVRDAPEANGKFPTVIYAASYQASSIENFSICEYLASHGFVVIASPSRGTDFRLLGGATTRNMETQARDMEFLLSKSFQMSNVDPERIGTMDFSFGGLSAILFQMRNERVKAIVSLDGSARYNFKTLIKSPFANIDRMQVPYVHMAQKAIPDEVLKKDRIDPKLNTDFPLFDSLRYSRATKMRFHHLSHSQFASLGVLLKTRDTRQDKSEQEIVNSYRMLSEQALLFFQAHLNKNQQAKAAFYKPKASEELVSAEHKAPLRVPFKFEDFNMRAAAAGYTDMATIYSQMRKEQPGFTLQEWKLNNLGLQLTYGPKTTNQGIQVLKFASQQFPNSANIFDSLGEMQLFAGQKNEAIESFKKSLELYPENQNAINRLKQLSH